MLFITCFRQFYVFVVYSSQGQNIFCFPSRKPFFCSSVNKHVKNGPMKCFAGEKDHNVVDNCAHLAFFFTLVRVNYSVWGECWIEGYQSVFLPKSVLGPCSNFPLPPWLHYSFLISRSVISIWLIINCLIQNAASIKFPSYYMSYIRKNMPMSTFVKKTGRRVALASVSADSLISKGWLSFYRMLRSLLVPSRWLFMFLLL